MKDLLAVRLSDIEAGIRRQKALAATLRLALATGNPTIDDLQRISQMIGHSQAQRYATTTAFLDMTTALVPDDAAFRGTVRYMWVEGNLIDRFWHCAGGLDGHDSTVSAEYKWLASATAFSLQPTS